MEAISPQCPDTKTERDSRRWTASSKTINDSREALLYRYQMRGRLLSQQEQLYGQLSQTELGDRR